MYLITNGQIITEETILTGYDLLIENDRIVKIALQGEFNTVEGVQIIDAAGGYVSPGFIDIHSDYIEHMAAPRPTCLMDFNLSIRETEKELISHGITTMFHSLSMYKTSEFSYKPIREAENVRKFVELIAKTHDGKHLIRHRFHARFEIDNMEEVENLKAYIAGKKVHLVSFMDHTPGQGQYKDLKIYRDTLMGYNDWTEEELDNIITGHLTKEKVAIEGMREIAELARENGIAVASHDDDTVEKLKLVQSFGATISEFPITIEVAEKAKEMQMFTMAGAPNILLGGSHSGNLSAAEAILRGSIDILCSDYYPPAMLHAVFEMHRKYCMDLAEMFRLVTINPAAAVNMQDEIGSVREGKKADLLVIEMLDDCFPAITWVIVDGKVIQKTNYIV